MIQKVSGESSGYDYQLTTSGSRVRQLLRVIASIDAPAVVERILEHPRRDGGLIEPAQIICDHALYFYDSKNPQQLLGITCFLDTPESL